MATSKKDQTAEQGEQSAPKPLTPEQALKQAVETVRAPYEAIREAQAKARAELGTNGSTGFAPEPEGD